MGEQFAKFDSTYILWDIDGTLLDTGGEGVKPLASAMSRVVGSEVTFERNAVAGLTDYEIIKLLTEGVRDEGLSEGEIKSILDMYSLGLEIGLASRPAKTLGSVRALLTELHEDEKFVMGILSGNCRDGGEIKIKSANLEKYFKVEDKFYASYVTPSRVDVLRQALKLSRNVVLVGDTPNDINAANEFNIPVISVATGQYNANFLENLNPGMVLSSNWSCGQFIKMIQSLWTPAI